MGSKNEYISLKIKDFDEIKTRLKRSPAGIGDFEKWIGKVSQNENIHGLKKSSINNIGLNLSKFKNKTNLSDVDNKYLDQLINKLEVLKGLVEKYFEQLQNQPQIILSQGHPKLNKYWFVYFFYNLRNIEPSLGIAVIELGDNGYANFYNVPDKVSVNYTGTYEHIHNEVLFFNFKSDVLDKSLHIKVYSLNKLQDELLLGAYLTYEDHHIVEGSVVLQAYPGDERPTPNLWNYRLATDSKEKIPSAIIDYLSLKWRNYHKVKRLVTDLDSLEFFTSQYDENWKNRFIEKEKIKVYLAVPSYAPGQSDIVDSNEISYPKIVQERILAVLEKKYSMVEFNKVVERNDILNRLPSPPNLNNLTHTRLFVLIYFKTDNATFSLVQLGWALAHCKSIIVFYEEKCFTNNLKRLRNMGVEVYNFNSLDEERKIYDANSKSIETLSQNIINRLELYLDKNTINDVKISE